MTGHLQTVLYAVTSGSVEVHKATIAARTRTLRGYSTHLEAELLPVDWTASEELH